MERRGLLTAAAAILVGASRPGLVAASQEGDYAYLTPGHRHERLAAVRAADGVRLRLATEDEAPTAGAVMLGIFRYDRSPQIFRRLVLPWPTIGAGLYVRSSVPYRIRAHTDPEGSGLRFSVVLTQPATVAVYEETPLGIERIAPWQVVVAIGPIRTPSAG